MVHHENNIYLKKSQSYYYALYELIRDEQELSSGLLSRALFYGIYENIGLNPIIFFRAFLHIQSYDSVNY